MTALFHAPCPVDPGYADDIDPNQLFAVFYLWYEGDSNLVDDSFCGIATSLESAINIANSMANGKPCEIFMPGQQVPNDGSYGDERLRYRIAVVAADVAYEDDHQPATQEQGAYCDSPAVTNAASICKSWFSTCPSVSIRAVLESLPDLSSQAQRHPAPVPPA